MWLVAVAGRENLLADLEILLVAHVFLGGLAAYLLAFRLTRQSVPALVAGIAYALGPATVSQAQHPAEAAVVEGLEFDGGPARRRLRVVSETRQHVVLDSRSEAPSLLITSETHYPGWEAFIDGEPAPVYYANVAFRSVGVPAGLRRIEFRFRPKPPLYGAATSGLSAALPGIYCAARESGTPDRIPLLAEAAALWSGNERTERGAARHLLRRMRKRYAGSNSASGRSRRSMERQRAD
jgi:hypothetical protein